MENKTVTFMSEYGPLIGVVIGAVITLAGTFLNNIFLKKTEYRNVYAQKMADKKIGYYSELEDAIAPLNNAYRRSHEIRGDLIVLLNQESFDKCFHDVQKLKAKINWFSDDVSEKFIDLCRVLEIIKYEKDVSKYFGAKSSDEHIREAFSKLNKAIHDDYFFLHDITLSKSPKKKST